MMEIGSRYSAAKFKSHVWSRTDADTTLTDLQIIAAVTAMSPSRSAVISLCQSPFVNQNLLPGSAASQGAEEQLSLAIYCTEPRLRLV